MVLRLTAGRAHEQAPATCRGHRVHGRTAPNSDASTPRPLPASCLDLRTPLVAFECLGRVAHDRVPIGGLPELVEDESMIHVPPATRDLADKTIVAWP
jgi:hypothetical protein